MPVIGAFILPHPPVILPEVGRGEQSKLQKTTEAFFKVAECIKALAPETIVLTSPHSVMYADYLHISPGAGAEGNMGRFGAPGVGVRAEYDSSFIGALEIKAQEEGIPAGTLGERDQDLDHGTVIPLKFIGERYDGYKLVRTGLSGLSMAEHYRFGMCIRDVSDALGKKTVLIASGDLSHKLKEDGPYGYAPEGVRFDREITEAMAKGDFMKFLSFTPEFAEKAAECGLRSCVIMAGALDGKRVESELLSYEGPFGVGYGIASFTPKGNDPDRYILDKYQQVQAEKLKAIKDGEDAYVKLARYSVENFVKAGRIAKLPEGLPEEMLSGRAGVFVSLKKNGNLRGCIGTIAPVTGSVAEEILRNGVEACSKDPRFAPVREDELDALVYSVDVLSPAEPVSSKDELDVMRYGVIVSSGQKRGLLLPNLDGVDTVHQQVAIAKQKAGIRSGEPVQLERFEVVRHH